MRLSRLSTVSIRRPRRARRGAPERRRQPWKITAFAAVVGAFGYFFGAATRGRNDGIRPNGLFPQVRRHRSRNELQTPQPSIVRRMRVTQHA
jgi:hypothetical protein